MFLKKTGRIQFFIIIRIELKIKIKKLISFHLNERIEGEGGKITWSDEGLVTQVVVVRFFQ